jgi:hypothetical protein
MTNRAMRDDVTRAAQRVLDWLDSPKAVPSASIQYDMRDLAKAALASHPTKAAPVAGDVAERLKTLGRHLEIASIEEAKEAGVEADLRYLEPIHEAIAALEAIPSVDAGELVRLCLEAIEAQVPNKTRRTTFSRTEVEIGLRFVFAALNKGASQ